MEVILHCEFVCTLVVVEDTTPPIRLVPEKGQKKEYGVEARSWRK